VSTLLNWSDGESFLGGSVIQPPKQVWLEERTPEQPTFTFEIYQLFDNLLRRGLAKLGKDPRRQIEQVPATPVKAGLARSERPWNVPVPTGSRLRAIYQFRNDGGVTSARLIAHHLGSVEVHTEGGADLGLEHLIGAPVGVNGQGEITAAIQFATDPTVQFSVLRPGSPTGYSLNDLVRDSYEELLAATPGLDAHPEDATREFEELFSDFLPEEATEGWEFGRPEPITGEQGDTIQFTIPIEAGAPGLSLIAIEARGLSDPDQVAYSEIFALEVNQDLEIRLLRGAEIAEEKILLPYERGEMEVDELQREIDRMWRTLEEDPDLAAAVQASGIETFDLPSFGSPVEVREAVAGSDPSTIVFAITGKAAYDLWLQVLLPRLRERFGERAVRRERPRD
jgi:hypothetical protein